MLHTKRLHLRNLKIDDLDSLYEYRNDPVCKTYQSWNDTSKKYLEKFILKNKNTNFKDNEIQLAIALKETDKIIGDLYFSKNDKTITLGYTISPIYHRKGYMYELLSTLIPYLFEIFKDYEIVCLVHPNNFASIKLLEKLEFKKEEYSKKINSFIYVKCNNK